MEYQFTQDWVSFRTKLWFNILKDLEGKPDLQMLEIGVFEGRSSVWFLETILTHETASLICIDPYPKELFYTNIAKFRHKIRIIKEKSQKVMRDIYFADERFDIIYIDGSHAACDVLEDSILSFRPLKKGGFMIFDDYLWKKDGELSEPKIAIDSFLGVFSTHYKLIHKEYQVIIQKL